MAQIQAQMTAQLRQLIYYHLDNECTEDANFLAARLYAMDHRNADSLHLLALTHLRLREFKTAYDYSQRYGATGRNLGCMYVFGLACVALGRHQDGITAVESARPLWIGKSNWNKHADTIRKHLPDAPAVLNLLAKLWQGHGHHANAAECLVEARKMNPFTWSSFRPLCDMSAAVDPHKSFQLTDEMIVHSSRMTQVDIVQGASTVNVSTIAHGANVTATPTIDPFGPPAKSGNEWSFQFPKIKAKGMFSSPSKSNAQPSWETPTANGISTDHDIEMSGVNQDSVSASLAPPVPSAPLRRSKTLSRLGLDNTKDGVKERHPQHPRMLLRTQSDHTDGEEAALPQHRNAALHKRTHSGHSSAAASVDATAALPRRSNRLFGQLGTSKHTTRSTDAVSSIAVKREADLKKSRVDPAKARGSSTVGRVVSGNRKVMPPTQDGKEPRAPSRNSVTIPMPIAGRPATQAVVLPDTAAIEELLGLFKQLGLGYHAMTQYDWKRSVNAFESLPASQRDTPWVMAQCGRVYYEASKYAKAEACYARMMKMQPSRVEDTEYYSTVLWHLKKHVQLSFLAHTLKEVDFEAPQTWCVIGNAFSLNREHDQAIACFKRASQINPSFSYAHLLTGHEMLQNEEYDSALLAYRRGVSSDRRAYSAWYGIAKCFERMGKLEDAEQHYRVAAAANKHNAVICVSIGAILERQRHPREALVQFTNAVKLDPSSVLAHFRRARSLMSLRSFEEAMQELDRLIVLAPEEANVWYMRGNCYKALGERGEAVKCLTIALNLDAKTAAHVKDALEAIDDSDAEDESEV